MIGNNIYRPPRSLNENYNECINEFSNAISSLKNNHKHNLILAGDFNINMLKINEQENSSNCFDMLTSFSLCPQIKYPTRFSNRTGTLIDTFFCFLTRYTLESTAGILIKKFSDHQPYFLILDTILKKEHTSKFVCIKVQNEAAMIKVKNDLISSEIHNKLDQSQIGDINGNYDIILDEITKSQNKNKFITKKLVKYNKYKHTKSTCITQGLLKSIKYRDKLYKQTLLTNPDLPEYQMLKINLKTYNGILKRSLRMAKQIDYKTCFNRFKYDAKNTWKTINEIISKSKTNTPLPK